MYKLLYHGKEEIHSEIVLIIFLTEVVQSHKYYKSCTVGVTSTVGLTTDRDVSVPMCLRNPMYFIPAWYWKSHGTSYYTT